MKDDLGTRMKEQYENRMRHMLPRRTYTVIRVDGKAFHTYTRGCEKPFDVRVEACMDSAAVSVFEEAQNARMAYVQSDEISVLLTDFARPETQAWFDGNLQKMCSVSASAATMAFNRLAEKNNLPPTAMFDARVFVIPDPVEVENYFIWRQKDAERNSVSMLAQSQYSHKQLDGKSCAEMHEMLKEKGISWDNLSSYRKYGRLYVKGGFIIKTPVFVTERSVLTSLVPRQWADENRFPEKVADVDDLYDESCQSAVDDPNYFVNKPTKEKPE